MLEWLERAESGRVFLDDGARRLTYGETTRQLAGAPAHDGSVIRPALTIESVLEILAATTAGSAVLLGSGVPDPQADGHSAATVLYTSGTSGEPKGVRLTAANWEAACRSSADFLGHGPDDTWLLAVPLRHVAGVGIVLRSAFTGGRVRLQEKFVAEDFAAALRTVTMASVVPTMLQRVLEADPGPFEGLRAVLVGGGPIPDGLLERAHAAGIPALPTYGMTESCGQVATLRPGSAPDHKVYPLPGVEIKVDADGGILLRGPMMFAGYVGEPDRDPGAWFSTGDLGAVDGDGAVRISGRADDLIITGGENVSPAAVEAALLAIAGVDDAIVFGLPSAEWGMEVGAVYTGSAPPEQVAGRLVLPQHARPRQIRQVAVIPRTPLGKPDRVAARMLLA